MNGHLVKMKINTFFNNNPLYIFLFSRFRLKFSNWSAAVPIRHEKVVHTPLLITAMGNSTRQLF